MTNLASEPREGLNNAKYWCLLHWLSVLLDALFKGGEWYLHQEPRRSFNPMFERDIHVMFTSIEYTRPNGTRPFEEVTGTSAFQPPRTNIWIWWLRACWWLHSAKGTQPHKAQFFSLQWVSVFLSFFSPFASLHHPTLIPSLGMANIVDLPVVPPPLPDSWTPPAASANSISRWSISSRSLHSDLLKSHLHFFFSRFHSFGWASVAPCWSCVSRARPPSRT